MPKRPHFSQSSLSNVCENEGKGKGSDTLLLSAQEKAPQPSHHISGASQFTEGHFRLPATLTWSCKEFLQSEYWPGFAIIFIIQHYKRETEVRGSYKVTQETCSSAGNKNIGLLTIVTNKLFPFCSNKGYSAKCLSFP